MEVSKLAMFFTMSQPVDPPTGDPPAGDPSGMFVSVYGANYWRVHWDNGDAEAYTRIYKGDIGSAWADSVLVSAELPGVTFANTGIAVGNSVSSTEATDDDYRFFARHFRNGELSGIAFVDSTDL